MVALHRHRVRKRLEFLPNGLDEVARKHGLGCRDHGSLVRFVRRFGNRSRYRRKRGQDRVRSLGLVG